MNSPQYYSRRGCYYYCSARRIACTCWPFAGRAFCRRRVAVDWTPPIGGGVNVAVGAPVANAVAAAVDGSAAAADDVGDVNATAAAIDGADSEDGAVDADAGATEAVADAMQAQSCRSNPSYCDRTSVCRCDDDDDGDDDGGGFACYAAVAMLWPTLSLATDRLVLHCDCYYYYEFEYHCYLDRPGVADFVVLSTTNTYAADDNGPPNWMEWMMRLLNDLQI